MGGMRRPGKMMSAPEIHQNHVVGSHEVEAESCSLEAHDEHGDSGILLKLCNGPLTGCHIHGAIQPPKLQPGGTYVHASPLVAATQH